MSLRFSYVLTGQGWAECAIEVDGTEKRMQVSYLSNGFDDLVRAVLSVVSNGAIETAVFIDEPGSFRWRLTPAGNRLQIEIIAYDEPFARANDPSAEVVFVAECRLRTFAGAVLAAGQQLLKVHGEKGYEEEWRHPFPSVPLANLTQALRQA